MESKDTMTEEQKAIDDKQKLYIRKWLVALLLEPWPHQVPISKLYGYDTDREYFDNLLGTLRLLKIVKVDYFTGVEIEPYALRVIMATLLHKPFGNFRQVCNHILDEFGAESVDARIAELLEKCTNKSGRFNFTVLGSEMDEEFF